MSEIGRPAFPLEYVDLEDPDETWTLDGPREVEANVEFVDDADPPYDARDALGRRVRLIVYNLELLVCEIVEQATALDVVSTGDAPDVWHEVSAGDRVHRALDLRSGRGWPSAWDEPLASWAQPAAGAPRQRREPADFHARWMTWRTGGRWP